MKHLLTKSLLIIYLTVAVASCSDSNENPIVGEWAGITKSQFGKVQNSVEFGNDGKYVWKYDYPDFDRIVKQNFYLKFILIATEISGSYKITGEEMVLSPLTRKNTHGGKEKALPPSVTDYEYVYPYFFEGEILVLIDEKDKQIRLSKKKGIFSQWLN